MPGQLNRLKPFLIVKGLIHHYRKTDLFSGSRSIVSALDGADLAVRHRQTLAVVGESGAGKSTLARCMALLETPTAGEILLEGQNILTLNKNDRFRIRREIQLVFQDPTSSLNPRLTAMEIVAEPLVVQREGTPAQQRRRALELMEQVGLPAKHGNKRPLEFSGGQRQRLAIARALALWPSLLILDESLSNLDLENQQLILELLEMLQKEFSLTFIHISHDLNLVRQIADDIAVMHRGRIVEQQTAGLLLKRPLNSYSRELLSAWRPVDSILEARFQGSL